MDRSNRTRIKSPDEAMILKVVTHAWQIERHGYVVLIEK